MKNVLQRIGWRIKGIKVFALVGKSGTGKSFRAQLLMQKYNIDLLVDDGLLIRDQKILAGRSAKREKAYMAAVKTALFHDSTHRSEIIECLSKQKFKRILIIGTSEGMVYKIAEVLELPVPFKLIKIEDIATKDDIKTALHYRNVHGQHVIPVPSIEVKRNYPKFMYDSVKIFLRRTLGLPGIPPQEQVFEKTVVRPEFTRKGGVTISEPALTQMVLHCVKEFEPQFDLKTLQIKNEPTGYHLHLFLSVPFGMELAASMTDLHKYVVDSIERFTGIIIDELHITVDELRKI